MVADLVEQLRDVFGWVGPVDVAAGPRGALGQIWQVRVGADRYALKEVLGPPPPPARIAGELAFAATTGVRVPRSHPARDGRYAVPAPNGAHLRLYDWIDLAPATGSTPADLGVLLAGLHRTAPPLTTELDGSPPSSWYDQPPAAHRWPDAAASGAPWADRLAERLRELPELCAAIGPADPARLVLCHRDLHPENVLADPDGTLVVLDWDNLGPADPSRELARIMFDWYHEGTSDLVAMGELYRAYLAGGGPGRVTGPADCSMLLAGHLNFLLKQARVALDPAAEPRHRAWAEREIDESLRLLPDPGQLSAALAYLRDVPAGR
ncbi:aminoglycoside phosphotransferase family protein [Catellatospora sp. KI3]|uniref:phosphotransferase enzyme family protein n=1 Tax=Catellatospora sp. KI3 TaxID=3041620 RepID=UPI00248247CC|nr:aminoglycoside phosphotransferase family protein [Catellatospora sp. KI3]MDI1461540.1 aminoglycoside phosphotransferase family protein [Catellatospora sp. KI3]